MNTSINNPIAEAIAPQKEECVNRAEQAYINYVENTIKPLLAEHGYDLQKAAPYPSSLRESRISYTFKLNKRREIEAITESVPSQRCRHHGDPQPVRISSARYARMRQQVRKAAGESFDAYVAKLTAKVGAGVVEAVVIGNLWDHSILTVTMIDASIQNWKTQQIINVSCLGKVFNQWPTRRMKDKAKK